MDLFKYISKRLLTLIPVLLGITFFAFLLGHISPGDPAEEALISIGIEVPSIEQLDEMREKMGLNDNIFKQYGRWVKNAVKGDLGTSYFTKKSISEEFKTRIPITLKISILALIMTIFLGIGIGLLMAIFKDTFTDKLLRLISVLFLSIPGFWLAIIMIIIFCEKLHLLPTSGNGGIKHMIMPAFVLASSTIAMTSRVTRSTLIKELGEQYIVVAKSKGLSQKLATFKHAFINSLVPIVTLIGNYFGGILGGATIVESIFSLQGMGSYVLRGISSRDYPIVQGYVLYTGIIYVVITLTIDIIYIFINPKIRLNGVNN